MVKEKKKSGRLGSAILGYSLFEMENDWDSFGILNEGDWDIFQEQPTSGKESADDEDFSAYLSREQRILTLQKDKYEQVLRTFQLSELEQRLFAKVPKDRGYMRSLVLSLSRIIRPILRSMTDYTDENAGLLLSIAGKEMRLSFVPEDSNDYHTADTCLRRMLMDAFRKDLTEKVVGFCVEEEGYKPFYVYGLKNGVHSGSKKNCLYPSYGVLCVDLADFLASVFIHQQINQLAEKIRKEGTKNALYYSFLDAYSTFKKRVTSMWKVYPEENSKGEPVSTFMLDGERGDVTQPFLSRLVTEGKIRVIPSASLNRWKKIYEESGVFIHVGSSGVSSFPFLFLTERYIPYNEMRSSTSGGIRLGLPDGVACSKGGYFTEHTSLFTELFSLICEEKSGIISSLKYYKKLKGDYAKSYMTKKGIPLNTQKAMEASLLNKHFGFVEYDQDVELSKVEEISKEFMAVWQTYLSSVDSTDNVIRFRKLGNHKAAGLYYPSVGCLCVDIRHPHSFIHEYGHLIDFKYGALSSQAAFFKVRMAYKELLLDSMQREKALNEKLLGNGKYNLDYYLTATEIFARSFELYMSKILGVKNSLLPEEFEAGVYPQSEEFLALIRDYFTEVFKSLQTGRYFVTGKAASH